MTYLNDLFDKVWHSTVSKDLSLGRLMVEQDVECCVFVGICSFVKRTTMVNEKDGVCTYLTTLLS